VIKTTQKLTLATTEQHPNNYLEITKHSDKTTQSHTNCMATP